MTNKNPTDEEINQFIEFLKFHSNYYKPVFELSKNINGKPLLPHDKHRNQFKMYGLDEICQSCSIFEDEEYSFYPKTTDAIWYKKHEDGSFYIFLIEFKGDKLYKNSKKCLLIDLLDTLEEKNKIYYGEFNEDIKTLKKIIPKYSDKLLNSLVLKPLETITVAIPLIYEHYYQINKFNESIKKININSFLKKSKIIYRVVSVSKNQNNRLKSRSYSNRISNYIPESCKKYAKNEKDFEVIKSYENNLKSYYRRYYEAGIINDKNNFIDEIEFNNFINKCLT